MTSDLKSISICATGWTFSGEIMLGGQKLIQSISPPIVFPIFCAHRTAIKLFLENLSKHFFLRFCQRARDKKRVRDSRVSGKRLQNRLQFGLMNVSAAAEKEK
jgi:hypothetical protein